MSDHDPKSSEADGGEPRIRIAGPVSGQARTNLVLGHGRFPASDEVLAVAADLACRLHADLHVVHSIDLFDYPIDPDLPDWDSRARDALDEQRLRVEHALAEAPGSWTYHAGRGDPAEMVIAVAEETDALMIILGSRGEGLAAAFERLLSGSVSRAVLRGQHRPVLIVPEADARDQREDSVMRDR